jgi:hypothetical protein
MDSIAISLSEFLEFHRIEKSIEYKESILVMFTGMVKLVNPPKESLIVTISIVGII